VSATNGKESAAWPLFARLAPYWLTVIQHQTKLNGVILSRSMLSVLLSLALVFSQVACACAATNPAPAQSSAHAEHGSEQSGHSDDSACSDLACGVHCLEVAAAGPDQSDALFTPGSKHFDHAVASQPEVFTSPLRPQADRSTGPPFRSTWRATATPIQRHDRLLI
tara:strand:+ start:9954 stop:10451 length:498 start_codon:yes stop_codon:yes gene_type:complete